MSTISNQCNQNRYCYFLKKKIVLFHMCYAWIANENSSTNIPKNFLMKSCECFSKFVLINHSPRTNHHTLNEQRLDRDIHKLPYQVLVLIGRFIIFHSSNILLKICIEIDIDIDIGSYHMLNGFHGEQVEHEDEEMYKIADRHIIFSF